MAKRIENWRRGSQKEEKPAKWTNKYIEQHLRTDTEEYVRVAIRDSIIVDDIWLFFWLKDNLQHNNDVAINTIFGNLPTRRANFVELNDEPWS